MRPKVGAMMITLSEIATYVTDRVSSKNISLEQYVTTDCILQDRKGRVTATNLPPQPCTLVKYKEGDVLVANIRPYLKKIWLADSEGGASSDVLVFRAKEEHSPQYLYAIMLQDAFYDYVMQGTKGSKMPRGDKEQIMRYSLPNVSKSSELAIGKFISDVCSKIYANERINQNLEAMVKQLYDYWFVQFDFPNEDGKPYKSNGGAMRYDTVLKRDIPASWSSSYLSEIANITMGQSPDGASYNEAGQGTIFYQGSTDFGMRFPSIRQYTTEPSRFAKKGDILMSVRAPVGATNIANNDCCIGRGLAALNSKMGSPTHLYYILDGLRTAFEQRNAAGTTFGSITKDDLYNLPIVKPSESVINAFEKCCKPIFDKQLVIGEEINSLIKQRDELLPLLMNGQVSVTQLNSDLSHD